MESHMQEKHMDSWSSIWNFKKLNPVGLCWQCTVHMFSVHMSGSVQCTVHSAHVCWKRKTVAHFWEDKQPENWKVNRIRLEEGQTQPWNVRNVSAPGSHFARLSVWGCTSKQRSGRFECILWSPCYLELNRPYPCCYILHIALQLRSLSIHPLAIWVIQWLWYVLTPSTSVEFDSVADSFPDVMRMLHSLNQR